MNRTFFAYVVIGIQIAFLSGWIALETSRLQPGKGESILVRTVPVDPRDLLRGQYINLQYEFSRSNQPFFKQGNAKLHPNSPIWAILRRPKTGNSGIYVPIKISLDKPTVVDADDVLMRGKHVGQGRFSFGIEKYFVPFGTETPKPESITVRLKIGRDYRPRIEKVYVNNEPWP